jgi:hypothetical protein
MNLLPTASGKVRDDRGGPCVERKSVASAESKLRYNRYVIITMPAISFSFSLTRSRMILAGSQVELSSGWVL